MAAAAEGHAPLEVSEAWAKQLAGNVFATLDSDRSGLVSISELIKALKGVGGGAQSAVLLLDALDMDSDGRISAAELCEGLVEAGMGNPNVADLLKLVEHCRSASAAAPA